MCECVHSSSIGINTLGECLRYITGGSSCVTAMTAEEREDADVVLIVPAEPARASEEGVVEEEEEEERE